MQIEKHWKKDETIRKNLIQDINTDLEKART
jgi:hypothetical protein